MTTTGTRRHLPMALAALLAASGPLLAPARADDGADKLLDDVVKAYKALDGYQDEGKYTRMVRFDGQEATQAETMSIALARPGKLDLRMGLVRAISDGKTLTTVVVPLKKYLQMPAPDRPTFKQLAEGPLGAMVMGEPGRMLTAGVVLALLLDDDAKQTILDGTDGTKLEADRRIDGRTVKPLLVDQSEGPDFRMLVDEKTKLLVGVELVFDPKAKADGDALGKQAGTLESVTWTAGKVETTAPKDETFAFKAPEGFDPIDEKGGLAAGGEKKEDAEKVEEPRSEVEKLVGKDAPDFKFPVLDGEKTKDISKADLQGKVVMIDFWATWCGPCLKELPDVSKMVKDLAKANKDVKVVALSIDEASTLKQMREVVEDTLKEKEIDLTGNSVGLVGLDMKGQVSRDYQIEGIPTILLLDRKGVVRAVHVGYTEREVLEGEINALLDGKPLDRAKDKDKD